jgi:hypothetical protein
MNDMSRLAANLEHLEQDQFQKESLKQQQLEAACAMATRAFQLLGDQCSGTLQASMEEGEVFKIQRVHHESDNFVLNSSPARSVTDSISHHGTTSQDHKHDNTGQALLGITDEMERHVGRLCARICVLKERLANEESDGRDIAQACARWRAREEIERVRASEIQQKLHIAQLACRELEYQVSLSTSSRAS